MKGGGNLIIGAAFYIDGGGGRPPQLYGRSATVAKRSKKTHTDGQTIRAFINRNDEPGKNQLL